MKKKTWKINLCAICGKPMGKLGKMHYACQDMKAVKYPGAEMQMALGKLENETKAKLSEGVKVWRKGMGAKRLAEMFPDMAGRV